MPTLHWIGKEKVLNHHMVVPFRVLEHKYGFTGNGKQAAETNSGNKIIHGDNLGALKALLPEYQGKIKCIYIDPPYNTGNENWVYNDNVNDPKILKWLHEVVGKEGEDLTRHDKWLCMIYPRLKLLHKLLSEDGAIFISIDDNEQANLKLLMDEIFGAGNFLANIVWRRRRSQANLSKNISPIHDFIICYSKSKKTALNKIVPNLNVEDYKNPDNDERGGYVTMPSTNKGGSKYSITTPTGKIIIDEWRFKEETYQRLLSENRLVFPKGGDGKPRYKLFLKEKMSEGVIANTWWGDDSSNQEASIELKDIFDDQYFETPKPSKLIAKIISLISDKDSIILDSFAGSGTTAHAVLNMNKQDGGSRKFICVELEDYAEAITTERIKRVIKGYPGKEPISNSFDYYELGPPFFNSEGTINELISNDKINQYIYYTETQQAYIKPDSANNYLLGKYNDTVYYFFYENNTTTTLNYNFLSTVDPNYRASQYVIYADNCLLSKDFMEKKNIVFKKTPRDITKF